MKSEAGDDDDRLIRGLASCEEIDADGEVVLQKGMDCTPCLNSGYVNWDHLSGPENLIGIPVKIEIAEIQSHPIMKKSGLKGMGMYAESRLLRGHSRANAVWELFKSLEGTDRKLAYSIQGSVLERSGPGDKVLTKSAIRHLAITHQPKQTCSFTEIVKSLTTVNAGPLKLETIDAGPMTRVAAEELLYGRCIDSHFNKYGFFKGGLKGAIEHLTICKSKSLDESKAFLQECITNRTIKL